MGKIFLYVLFVASVMSSCMKHDNLYNGEGDDDSNKKKEEYDKNFPVKDIDPEQNWNMAKQVIVNVTVNYEGGSEYTIKIYSDNPRDPEVQAYLLGKYTVKSGSTNALKVDAVASLKSVYVCCVDATGGSVMRKGTVEAGKTSVAFGTVAGRSVSGRADADDEWVSVDVEALKNLVNSSTGTLREDHKPSGGGVMTSYEFEYNGPFTIYVIFGTTGGNDEIGYYFYGNDEELEKSREENHQKQLISNIQNHVLFPFEKAYLQCAYEKKGELVWDNWDFHPTYYDNVDYIQEMEGKMRAKPFRVDIEGLTKGRVGFYIKNGNGNKYYSNSKLNTDNKEYSAVVYDNTNSVPKYIGLEDDPNAVGDFNDIIFEIPKAENNDTPPIVVGPDTPTTPSVTWTIACEDLGSIGDYDFNDIVFGISYVKGEREAKLIPYAAGGTLAANIYWGTQNLGEIHNLLEPGASTTTMINTNSKGKPGDTQIINVGKDFSITNNMGGFTIKVGDEEGTTIVSPHEGEAPQMICVSGEWVWPKERTNIIEAYSGFEAWAADHTTNTDWWEKSNSGTVVQ